MNAKMNSLPAHSATSAILLILSIMLFPDSGAAQSIEALNSLTGEVDIRGKGWSQLKDVEEVLEFCLGVLETVLMTAIIAFHPKNKARWQGRRDWEAPRTFFLFALTGMVVGFLVIHHGYLIGFVVFGIGSFLRFRMESSSLVETPQLIFTSLIGLVVGLDLPVMALVATLSAFVVIWVFARRAHFALEVKFNEDAVYSDVLAGLQTSLSKSGFVFETVTKSKFKPIAEIVLSSSDIDARTKLVAELAAIQRDADSGVIDWHLE